VKFDFRSKLPQLRQSKSSRNQLTGRAVALDLDSQQLRIALVELRKGDPVVKKLASVATPADLDQTDAEAVGKFIRNALSQKGIGASKAVMSVRRSQAVIKAPVLPPVDHSRELPAMVRYQVGSQLPFDPNQAVIDFVELGQVTLAAEDEKEETVEAQGVQVLVAAVQGSVREFYQQVAQVAGLKLLELGLCPYADVFCLQSMWKDRKKNIAGVLVHLTADEAEISTLIDGRLIHTRSAPIVKAQVSQPGAPAGSSEDQSENRPDALPTTQAPTITEQQAAEQALKTLVVEVMRSRQSAVARRPDMKVDQIWVTGGTGQEKALADALRSQLKATCEVLDVVKTLQIKRADEADGGFIGVIGAAMAACAAGDHLDLLNPKKPPVQRDIKKIKAMSLVGAVAAVLLIIAGYGVWSLGASKSEYNALTKIYNEEDAKNRPVRKLQARTKSIEAWVKNRHKWLDHLANINSSFPSAKEAYITSFKTSPDGMISLTVRARTSTVITDVIKRLREAGYKVKPGSETTNEDEYGYRSSMTLRLEPGSKMKIDVAKLPQATRPEDDGSHYMISQSRSRTSSNRRTSGGSSSSNRPSGNSSSSGGSRPSSSGSRGGSSR